jgi:hypothetical protein
MIEAVTAVVSNAQLLRSVAEQTSTTQTLAANPTRVQTAAISAPYLSPHVDYNSGNSKPIFVVRDSATGETLKQFPSEAQIRAYQKAAYVREQVIAQTQFQQGSQDAAFAAAQRNADIAKSSVEFKAARQAVKQQTESAAPAVVKHTGGGSSHRESKSVDTQA